MRSWSRRWRSRRPSASSATTDGAHHPRRLDLLHLRRTRRRRRPDAGALRRGHALPLAAAADDQRREAPPALVGCGRVLLGRVLSPQPRRGRASPGHALDHARALRGRGDAGPDRRPQRGHGAALLRARPGARNRLRGHPLRQGARLRSRRPEPGEAAAAGRSGAVRGGAQPVRARGSERRDGPHAGDSLRAGRDRGHAGRLPPQARAARGMGTQARHPRVDPRRQHRAADGRAALRRGADARPGVARSVAATRAADSQRLGRARAELLALRRGPCLAAHARRWAQGPFTGGGHAVVHDGLRPRHAHHVPPDAAVRSRARPHRARDPRRAPGPRGRPGHRRRAGQDRPRAPLRSCRRELVSRVLRDGGRDAAVHRPALGGLAVDGRLGAGRRAEGAGPARARLDRSVRRPRRRRLRRVPAAHPAGARESVVEGLRRLAALPRRHYRPLSDRALRGSGLRLRCQGSGGRAGARGLARPPARRAARAGGAGAAAALRRAVLDGCARRLLRARARRREAAGRLALLERRAPALERHRPGAARGRDRGRADGAGALVGLGRAHHVDRGRRLQPALVPQRNRLAPRQLPDRAGPRPVQALARGAADHPTDARRGGALRLPAAGGLRGPAALGDAVPHRLPDRRTSAGLGRGDSGAPAAAAARPRARPERAPFGDERTRRAAVLGGPLGSPLRYSSFRPPVGRASRARTRHSRGSMRIAVLAPPWFAVPPTGYGGIEWIVWLLADGLVEHGHDVTLFAAGDSHTKAKLASVFDHAPSEQIGRSLPDLRHILACYERAEEFDVINDHTGPLGAVLGGLLSTPVVHTVHGPLDGEPGDVYQGIGRVAPTVGLISISLNQRRPKPDLNWIANVPNALDLEHYPCKPHRGDYLLFLGRFNHEKGAHRAVAVAMELGLPLKLAGKMREPREKEYFAEFIEPHLGNGIEYLGEVNHGTKVELLQNARATLFPIEWEEPFGLVMIESMACGTPVIATRQGAVPEVIGDGTGGVIVDHWNDIPAALEQADAIEPTECRRFAEEQFAPGRMVADYERAYREAIG